MASLITEVQNTVSHFIAFKAVAGKLTLQYNVIYEVIQRETAGKKEMPIIKPVIYTFVWRM